MNAAEQEWRMRVVGAVTRLFDHYGRKVLPTTIADVAQDLMRFSAEEVEAAAAEVRRNVVNLRDSSLSALLTAEIRVARRRRALDTPLLPRRVPTAEEKAAAKMAVGFVRSLSRRMNR